MIVAPLAASALHLSHAWIVVKTGAPQRQLLQKAGFKIDPAVNHHDGQGTSSISVELDNGYLELIYPDPKVSVAEESKVAAQKFRLKSEWRTSGYSPIGIVFDRTAVTPASFPFPTWKVTADWMSGRFIEMLTPREMPRAVSLSIGAYPSSGRGAKNANGTRQITALRVVAPSEDRLPPAAAYAAANTPVTFDVGSDWLLEVTLDKARRNLTKDFRPDLPLVVRH